MFLVNYNLKKIIFFTIFLIFVLSMATASELDAESKIEIKASDKLEWDQSENKIVAYGDSVVKSSFFSINANKIVGFYKGPIGKGKIQRLIANENAVFETSQTIINSNFMNYDLAKETLLVEGDNISMLSNFGTVYSQNSLLYDKIEKKIILDGDVLINLKNPEARINANKLVITIDENEKITSVKALEKVKVKIDSLEQNISSDTAKHYNIDQKINFEGNVIIKQNESYLKGDSAVIDFKKGLSSMSSNEQNSVTGVFY